MRLPIAYSPLNLFLLMLMILAPYLGKKAKNYYETNQQEMKIHTMMSVSKSETVKEKSKKKRKKRRRPSLSSPAYQRPVEKEKPEEKPKPAKKLSQAPLEMDNGQQGEMLLSKYRNVTEKPAPRLLPEQKEETKEIAKEPESSKAVLFKKIRACAMSNDGKKAEQYFLESLETADLSPLESLEKLNQFREHFKSLSSQLSSSSSISI
jgi:hypothetical protein